jgi:hypothetical protein
LSQEVTDSAPVRTRIRIQTVELTADQIFTEARRYYFVWGGPAANDPVQILPLPSGFTDARSGISLPYELGWLHFDGATDGEAENPGLGVTIAYVGAWAKGTIFLYDKRQHVDSTDQGRLEAEFRAAIEVALKAMPGSSVKALGPISDDSEQSEWRLALLESPKNTMSAVLLAAAKGFFVKGRIDWQASDKQTDKMGLACVGAAMKIVS